MSVIRWGWRSSASSLIEEMRMKVVVQLITLAFISAVISATRSETNYSTTWENDVVPVLLAVKRSSSPQLPQPLMVPLTLIQGAASKGAGIFLFYLLIVFTIMFWKSDQTWNQWDLQCMIARTSDRSNCSNNWTRDGVGSWFNRLNCSVGLVFKTFLYSDYLLGLLYFLSSIFDLVVIITCCNAGYIKDTIIILMHDIEIFVIYLLTTFFYGLRQYL